MAALSLWLSALPPAVKLPAILAALAEGLRQARRHLTQPALALDWLGGDEPAYLTTSARVVRLDRVTAHLRGPLASLSGTDAQGRLRRLAWWPDTLGDLDRRQLRLASAVSRRSANPLRKQAA